MKRIYLFILLIYFGEAIDLGLWELFQVNVYYLAIRQNVMWKLASNALSSGGYYAYKRNETDGQWIFDVAQCIQLAIDAENTYCINAAMNLYYKSQSDGPLVNWPTIDAGFDIKVGTNDHIWFLTTPIKTGGYTIKKLDIPSFTRTTIPGTASKIAPTPDGNAWCVNSFGDTYKWNGTDWNYFSVYGRDIVVGPDGIPFIVGQSSITGGYEIHKWNPDQNTWVTLEGIGGILVTLDKRGNPYIITNSYSVYRPRGVLVNFCNVCLIDCENCADVDTCSTCQETTCFPDDTCIRCQLGSYGSLQAASCLPCLDECKTCENGYSCKECKDGLFLHTNGYCGECVETQFLYANGSCLSTCSFPFRQNLTVTEYKQCDYYVPSNSQKNVEEAVQGTQTSSNVAAQIITALSGGSPGGLMIGVAGRIFFIIKFFNISRSLELEHALQNWKSDFVPLDFDWMMPSEIGNDIVLYPLPEVFSKRQVSSSFLLNSWDNIVFMLLLCIICIIAQLTKLFVSKKKNVKALRLIEKLKVGVQNYTLTQLYAMYGDMVFYILLEYQAFRLGNWSSDLSLSVSLIILITIIISFTLHIKLLSKYQKIKKESVKANDPEKLEKFKKSHQGVQLLFQEFKDDSISQHAFLLFLTARDILFSFIITVLYQLTISQIFLFLLLNLMGFIYLIKQRPYKERLEEIQQFTCEFIFLFVTILEFLGCVLDDHRSDDTRLKRTLGKLLIIINISFNMISLIFMAAKLTLIIKESINAYKLRNKTKINLKLKRRTNFQKGFQILNESQDCSNIEIHVLHNQEISFPNSTSSNGTSSKIPKNISFLRLNLATRSNLNTKTKIVSYSGRRTISSLNPRRGSLLHIKSALKTNPGFFQS